jgi:hypothetical protein
MTMKMMMMIKIAAIAAAKLLLLQNAWDHRTLTQIG